MRPPVLRLVPDEVGAGTAPPPPPPGGGGGMSSGGQNAPGSTAGGGNTNTGAGSGQGVNNAALAAIKALAAQTAIVNAMTQAGNIIVSLSPILTQLQSTTGNDALIAEGAAIVTQCQTIATDATTDHTSTVAALTTQAASWQVRAQTALSQPQANAPGAAWQPSHAYAVGDTVLSGANTYTCTTAGTSAASGGPTGTATAIADGSVVWQYASGADDSTTAPTDADAAAASAADASAAPASAPSAAAPASSDGAPSPSGGGGGGDDSADSGGDGGDQAAAPAPPPWTEWAPSTSYAVGDMVSSGGSVYLCSVAGTSAESGGPTGTDDVVDGEVTWSFQGADPDAPPSDGGSMRGLDAIIGVDEATVHAAVPVHVVHDSSAMRSWQIVAVVASAVAVLEFFWRRR